MGWKSFLKKLLTTREPNEEVSECDYKYYCAWRGDYPLLMGQGWTEEEAIKVLNLAIKKEEELGRRTYPGNSSYPYSK